MTELRSSGLPRAAPVPTFAIVAHNDDWQMFMGSDIAAHIAAPDERVVIVQLTAGDAGRSEWFWKARQQGAIASVIRATGGWAAVDLPSVTPATPHAVHDIAIEDAARYPAAPLPSGYAVRYDVAVVRERSVLRCTVTGTDAAPTTIYFLHLPDGAVGGGGFAATGFASLARLAAGECANGLHALWTPPGGIPASYVSWDAVVDMLAAVIATEIGDGDGDGLWVHTMADAPLAGDHSDHALTSRAVSELNRRAFGERLRIARCIGYTTQYLPTHRNDAQRAVLAAYAGGFTAAAGGVYGWNTVWEKEQAWWGDREYWETPTGPTEQSPCRETGPSTGSG